MKYLKVEKLFSVRIFTVGRVCQTLIGKFDRLSKIASRLRSRLTIMIWIPDSGTPFFVKLIHVYEIS